MDNLPTLIETCPEDGNHNPPCLSCEWTSRIVPQDLCFIGPPYDGETHAASGASMVGQTPWRTRLDPKKQQGCKQTRTVRLKPTTIRFQSPALFQLTLAGWWLPAVRALRDITLQSSASLLSDRIEDTCLRGGRHSILTHMRISVEDPADAEAGS